MNKKLLISFAIILSGVFAMAQEDSDTVLEDYEAKENLRELGSLSGVGSIQTFDNRYQGVKGTQFAFENWYPGEIFMKEKARVKFPNLNYNVFTDIVSYKELESESIFEINKTAIDFFVIYGADSMKFVPIALQKTGTPSFAEIVYSGKTKLYKVYLKEFIKANYEGGYSADRRHDEFVDKVQYYALFPGSTELIRIKTSKAMAKQFPSSVSEMKKLIGSYPARELDNRNVLRELMEFYDGI